ncbi:MAG: hypothetical protein ACR652_03310 [Methylocystis sp.]|uniref:hypothetical protein n=1 Tax=Methylocystis sp. TaxID=1911079 RepID=UPI003DA23D92
MKRSEIAPPVAVWRAVEGDRSELVALLRSGDPLTRRTRDALADWLEGSLKPVKLPKGRPAPDQAEAALWCSSGHDLRTKIGWAGRDYDRARAFLRKKGWHLKKAGSLFWSTERLLEAVAKRHNIQMDALENYLKRARSKPPQFGTIISFPNDDETFRRDLALQIRRKKMSPKG